MADSNNIKIEEQLNKMLRDRSAMLQAQTREMQSQLQLSLQMKAVMDGAKAEEMLDRLNEAQKAFEGITQKAKEAGDASNGAMDGWRVPIGPGTLPMAPIRATGFSSSATWQSSMETSTSSPCPVRWRRIRAACVPITA